MNESSVSNEQKALALRDRSDVETRLRRMRRIATLMDDQFELPLVKYRVGLDPIIGLIPGGGDWVTWVVAVYILWGAIQLGVPIRLLIQMGLYLTLDLVVGYAPGVGDIADVVIKANKRNVDLVVAHFEGTVDPVDSELVHVPRAGLEKPRSNPVLRYGVGIALTLFLLVLAAVPLLAIWWYFTRE